jgi:hypothetical protein
MLVLVAQLISDSVLQRLLSGVVFCPWDKKLGDRVFRATPKISPAPSFVVGFNAFYRASMAGICFQKTVRAALDRRASPKRCFVAFLSTPAFCATPEAGHLRS